MGEKCQEEGEKPEGKGQNGWKWRSQAELPRREFLGFVYNEYNRVKLEGRWRWGKAEGGWEKNKKGKNIEYKY